MREPIVVPPLDWPTILLSVWYVKPGETLFSGDRVVELLLGGATFDITAPASGTLLEQCARPGDLLSAGQVVAHMTSEEPRTK